jgi:hypothetical protein
MTPCTSSTVAAILKLKSAWNLSTSSPLNIIRVGTTTILNFAWYAFPSSLSIVIYLIPQSVNLFNQSTLFASFHPALNCTTQISLFLQSIV